MGWAIYKKIAHNIWGVVVASGRWCWGGWVSYRCGLGRGWGSCGGCGEDLHCGCGEGGWEAINLVFSFSLLSSPSSLLPPLFSLIISLLKKKKNLVIKDDNVRSPIPLMLSMGILLYVKHLAVLHLQTPPAWRILSREVSSQKTSNTFLIISYSFVNIC